MKKILLLLCLFFISTISNCQIQREIFGLTLGKTTKSQCKAILAKHGHKFYNDDQFPHLMSTEPFIKYNNIEWAHVYFEFEDDKLRTVMFSNTHKGQQIIDDLKYIYSSISKKYNMFYVGNSKTENGHFTWYDYQDSNTSLRIEIIESKYTQTFNIIFEDLKLQEKENQ